MLLEQASDSGSYGGKAASLAQAAQAGLPVPHAIALTAAQVMAMIEGDDDAPRREVERLQLPVAVRSSAIGEDGCEHSFAGQHLTSLNAGSWDEVVTAVADVYASGSSAGATAYRRRRGIDEGARVAVLVQEMVPAEVSGVMFTRDPNTGEEVRVVEATWGLGEAVVAGLVIPDQYRLAPDGSVLSIEIGEKDIAVVPSRAGGTEERSVSPEMMGARCLDDSQLRKLAALAESCEQTFGPGQDIEWAFAGGELKLLQSRPITTAPSRSEASRITD